MVDLSRLVAENGGGLLSVERRSNLNAVTSGLAIKVLNEYTLGIDPGSPRNAWHEIEIGVRLPKSFEPVKISGPSSYYY
jgi:hypothetical protein